MTDQLIYAWVHGKPQSDYTYKADSNGYMLFWRGLPIGGAGVRLPRERPLRGHQAMENAKEFGRNAQQEIAALVSGKGQQRFIDAIAKFS